VRKRHLLLTFALVALTATAGATAATRAAGKAKPPVDVTVFSPREGDVAGKESKGFFVDLAVRYRASRRAGPVSS
jgi:threonine synthase